MRTGLKGGGGGFLDSGNHRVDRVQGFSPVVRIGTHNPLTNWRVCPPPPLVPGGHTRLREGVGGSQFGRGDRHCGTLGINVLCGGNIE